MRVLTLLLVCCLLYPTMPAPCRAAEPATESPVDSLLKRYPDARVYHVSPEEFRKIEPLLRTSRSVVVAELAQLNPHETPTVTNSLTNSVTGVITNPAAIPAEYLVPTPVSSMPAPSAPRPHPEELHSCNVFFDLTHDLGSSDLGDAAIIIFVVIGVTVVLAVVVYAGAFLYELVSGSGQHTYWWDIEVQSSILTSSRSSGYLAGLKLSSGFEAEDARVGLVIEGGAMDARIRPDETAERIDAQGAYAMAGAGIRWAFSGVRVNPSFLGFELLAGTATDERVHLMSTARANLSFGLGSRTRFGLSLGALYLGLDTTEGPVTEVDNFTTLLGVQAGYRF